LAEFKIGRRFGCENFNVTKKHIQNTIQNHLVHNLHNHETKMLHSKSSNGGEFSALGENNHLE